MTECRFKTSIRWKDVTKSVQTQTRKYLSHNQNGNDIDVLLAYTHNISDVSNTAQEMNLNRAHGKLPSAQLNDV